MKDKLLAIQTNRGIVSFDSKEDFEEWKNTGMNRFSITGELEEIDLIIPEQKILVDVYSVIYIDIEDDTYKVVSFGDFESAEKFCEENLDSVREEGVLHSTIEVEV